MLFFKTFLLFLFLRAFRQLVIAKPWSWIYITLLFIYFCGVRISKKKTAPRLQSGGGPAKVKMASVLFLSFSFWRGPAGPAEIKLIEIIEILPEASWQVFWLTLRQYEDNTIDKETIIVTVK